MSNAFKSNFAQCIHYKLIEQMLSFYAPTKKRFRSLFDELDLFNSLGLLYDKEIEFYKPLQKHTKKFESNFDVTFNVEETDEGKKLTCELPDDYDDKDIKININRLKNVIEISMTNDKEWKSDDGNSFGKSKTEVTRSFSLDKDCDIERIKSSVANNQLKIILPNKSIEEESVVEIPIEIIEN